MSDKNISFDVVYYVPAYQVNDPETGNSHFTYSMADATQDEQMAWSFEPDYVLRLKGTFDAKLQPYDINVAKYNQGHRDEE